jgi:hypothetical protein
MSSASALPRTENLRNALAGEVDVDFKHRSHVLYPGADALPKSTFPCSAAAAACSA